MLSHEYSLNGGELKLIVASKCSGNTIRKCPSQILCFVDPFALLVHLRYSLAKNHFGGVIWIDGVVESASLQQRGAIGFQVAASAHLVLRLAASAHLVLRLAACPNGKCIFAVDTLSHHFCVTVRFHHGALRARKRGTRQHRDR